MSDVDAASDKAADREAKKAEVRRRLEEAGAKKKAKKGFLTPERKKKLRKLLMVKAAEDLKRQQLVKEQERNKILAERTLGLPDVDSVNDKAKLEQIYNDMFARICKLEAEKFDINHLVSETETNINSLAIEVNDLRGKFVKPSLKKVSKYDNKFKKMAETSESKTSKREDFRTTLKVVKKDVMEEITNVKKKEDKPEWSKKAQHKEGDAPKEESHAAAAAPAPASDAEAAENEDELPSEEPEVEEEEEEEEEEE